MKLALSAKGDNLDAPLDPRFGRCAYYLVINPDDMSFEAFKNDSAFLGGGAGIQAAQFLSSKGVDAVITGNCGPNAVQTLAAAGVDLFAGQAGIVREVVERFKNGSLRSTNEAIVDSHYGMGADTGLDRRSSTGRGMGGGRGQRRGMGMPASNVAGVSGNGIRSNAQELEGLKQQASRLNEKMKEVISRIARLANIDRS